jgi:hypothetical protein
MATRAPEETDILCENCGYMLNGLPPSGNCPECGTAIDFSISERLRQPPLWEIIGDPRPAWLRFLLTTSQIIFTPTHFFRSTTSRGQVAPAYRFARIHWVIAAIFLGLAAYAHWDSYETAVNFASTVPPWLGPLVFVTMPIIALFGLVFTIRLAGKLTAWEAAYRGYRLPHTVVIRALYYHSAHLLPVALLGFITCAGYDFLLHHWLQKTSELIYLYILCGEVILSAGYLFNTYWIGMRNLMYANR